MNDLYTTAPKQIVMYTTEYCSDCMRAKKFFEAHNIPHVRVGLEGNLEATEFVMKVNHGYRSVPTIVFPDGSILVEPDWEELKAKFSNSCPGRQRLWFAEPGSPVWPPLIFSAGQV